MPNRWFAVPEVEVDTPTGTGTDPEYADRVEAYSNYRRGNSPRRVVRYYADESTLDAIAANDNVRVIDDEVAQVETDRGGEWTQGEVDRVFSAGV